MGKWKKRDYMIILHWTLIWFFKEAFVLDITKNKILGVSGTRGDYWQASGVCIYFVGLVQIVFIVEHVHLQS